MNMLDVLQDVGKPVAYYPALADALGSIEAALFLCQLTYWDGKQANKAGWIYKTAREMQEETGLSRRKQETARRILRDLGILEECYAKVPKTLHFRVCRKRFDEVWQEYKVREVDTEDEKALHQTYTLSGQNDEPLHQNATLMHQTYNLNAPNVHSITETTAESTAETTDDASCASTIEATEIADGKDDEEMASPKVEQAITDAVSKSKIAQQKQAEKAATRPQKPKVYTAKDAMKRFAEQFTVTFGGIAPLEVEKDRVLMKKLVEHYGYDTVASMIDWLFQNWKKFRQECKLTGLPTVGMLFGFRAYLQERILVAVPKEAVGGGAWGV